MKLFVQKPNKRIQKIHVISFDMDQCIFHPEYNWLPDNNPSEVINKNIHLLNSIKAQSAHYNLSITFLGSSRQTKQIDTYCSTKNKSESAFVAIKKIASYLGTQLDEFLLADIYFDLPDGTSFQKAIDGAYSGFHAIGPNDETKFTLLYAQIHKVANQYPHAEITFDFYDDGGFIKNKILGDLAIYFSEMPDKLPANVILNLIHYEGKETTLINFIQGAGFIDENYRKTVFEITNTSRRSISFGCSHGMIDEHSLRLDDVVFFFRKPLNPPLIEDARSAIEPVPTPPVIEEWASLPLFMMDLVWFFLSSIVNYIANGTTVEAEEESNEDNARSYLS